MPINVWWPTMVVMYWLNLHLVHQSHGLVCMQRDLCTSQLGMMDMNSPSQWLLGAWLMLPPLHTNKLVEEVSCGCIHVGYIWAHGQLCHASRQYSCEQPKPTYFAAMGIAIWDMTGTTPEAWKCWKTFT